MKAINRAILPLALALAVALGGIAVQGVRAVSANAPAEPDGIELPIVMYHHVLKEQARLNKYTISPDEFRSDMEYLKTEGYTPIVIADLLAYVEEGAPLPERPVMITFDDGYESFHEYVFPILKEYDFKAVYSIVGRYADQYSAVDDHHIRYSHSTWNELREMRDSGLVEIQNHSYNLHSIDSGRKGAKKKAVESLVDYRTLLVEDVMKMQTRMREETGYTPTAFVYPFGAVSSESLPILKELGFQATLICESHINAITRDPECLYGLGRYRRPAKTGSEAFFKKILPKES